MICIVAENPSDAWLKSFTLLYKNGKELEINGFYKNSSAAIEIANPDGKSHSNFFPIPIQMIKIICEYLVNGVNESDVDHEWTKIYRQRLFIESDFVDEIIDTLKLSVICNRRENSVLNNTLI